MTTAWARVRPGPFSLRASAVSNFEYLLLAGIFVLALLFVPNFSTVTNLTNVLRQGAVLGIVTCGVTLLLLAGRFDLSVGSILSLCSVCTALFLQWHLDMPIAILGGLLVGMAAGGFNALAIEGLGGNPVIVTLGSQFLFQGLALLVTGGQFISVSKSPDFLLIGRGQVFGIGYPVLIYLGIAFVLQWLLQRSRSGQLLYVIGTNDRLARLSGIRVGLYRSALFVISGALCAVAAIVLIARTADASSLAGQGYEFDAITAAVLGGVALFGGSGSVTRSIVGVLILAMLADIQTLMGVPIYGQLFVKALVLAITVWLQVAARRNAADSA